MTSITSADCLFLRYITCTVFWLIMWQVLHFIRIDCLKMVDFPLLHWTPYISTMPIFTLLFCQIFDFFNQSQHASVIFITYTTLLLKNNILTSVRFFLYQSHAASPFSLIIPLYRWRGGPRVIMRVIYRRKNWQLLGESVISTITYRRIRSQIKQKWYIIYRRRSISGCNSKKLVPLWRTVASVI
jgi:hypothetical protein